MLPNPDAMGDIGDRQLRVVQQSFRKVQSAGMRNRRRRGTDMLREQPTQMTNPDANAIGEVIDDSLDPVHRPE